MAKYIVTYRLSESESKTYNDRYDNLTKNSMVIFNDKTTSTIIYKSGVDIEIFTNNLIKRCNLLETDKLFVIDIKDDNKIFKYDKGEITEEIDLDM